MSYLAYSGNWIVCGSYALVHAAGLSCASLIPLENSTGSPFGISCAGEDSFGMRMLSVFRDFNYGIDSAAPLWGIQMKGIAGVTKEPIEELLGDTYIDRVVIGPVSMVGLAYLPLSQQYRCADHFIACIRRRRDMWQLIDSEGVPGLPVTSGQILSMLSIQNIPEACGRYTARAVLQVNASNTSESRIARIRHTLETAYTNLKDAQESGQGYRAFERCAETIQDCFFSIRRSLLYDVDYLIQRKIMLLQLLQEAKKDKVANINSHIITEANQFIEVAGTLRGSLNDRSRTPQKHLFDKLAGIEKRITEAWEEWVVL